MTETTTFHVLEQHSLKAYNTFGIDAKARYFVRVQSSEDVRQALSREAFAGLPRLILGGGSNLLLTGDFPGVVIHIELMGKHIVRRDDTATFVAAAAGENWHGFVLWSLDQGLAGLENLSLIPGTVGASPIQNIGAYGVELQNIFHELSAIDITSGEERVFNAAACRFGYRDSVFKQAEKNRCVITQVSFRLPHNAPLHLDYGDLRDELARLGSQHPTAREVSAAVTSIRRRKLPDPATIGNAGSFFKNPVVERAFFNQLHRAHPAMPHYPAADGRVKLAAAWLIEQTGWKGKVLGRAGVHAQHALVLVNLGGADGAEILALAQAIQHAVRDQFNILLEPEPTIL